MVDQFKFLNERFLYFYIYYQPIWKKLVVSLNQGMFSTVFYNEKRGRMNTRKTNNFSLYAPI